MIDWNRITGFDWGAGNARKSRDKHGVTQAESEQIFFNEPLLLLVDIQHSKRERRYHAYGKTDLARKLHITMTLRNDDTLIRIISARDMHPQERKIYEQA